MIDLGEAGRIDRAIMDFRNEIQARGLHYREKGRELFQLIFEPFLQEIGDSRMIFLSPDGNLSLIPFETLVDNNNQFLTETYTFNYLNSGRDLLRFTKQKEIGKEIVLIGHPDFNNPDSEQVVAIEDNPYIMVQKKKSTRGTPAFKRFAKFIL